MVEELKYVTTMGYISDEYEKAFNVDNEEIKTILWAVHTMCNNIDCRKCSLCIDGYNRCVFGANSPNSWHINAPMFTNTEIEFNIDELEEFLSKEED